jgi:hypothetical protein
MDTRSHEQLDAQIGALTQDDLTLTENVPTTHLSPPVSAVLATNT